MISFEKISLLALITVLMFICTFIPFVLNHLEDFMTMNPFIIQSNVLMPIEYTILSILISFITYFVVNDKNDVFFYSGLILFLTIILYYIYLIDKLSFRDVFFNSVADISYFIFCIPFILYYLIEIDVKRCARLYSASH